MPQRVRDTKSRSARNHQIDRLRALALLVGLDLEGDALSFSEVLESRALYRGDVDEHVAPAIIGLDEAVAALAVEELDRPRHGHRENSCPRIASPCASAHRLDRTVRGRKAWPSGRPARRSAKNLEALSLRRPHSRKRNVKPVPTPQHSTVPPALPTDISGLGQFEPEATGA